MQTSPEITLHPVKFTGSARAYFGVWLSNLLLSVVTFGIYSAWAKVRRKRFFHQNTVIDGRRFDYHATGKQILIGRAVVFVGFIIYSVLSAIPLVGIVLGVALLFAFPWFLSRSLRFNARSTSFSGVRFGFSGTYWGAFRVYLLYPFLALFTLYLAYPFVIRAQKNYSLGGHSYGTAKFTFESRIWPFYKAALLAALCSIIIIVVGVAFMFSAGMFVGLTEVLNGAEPDPTQSLIFLAIMLLVFIAVLPGYFIYSAFIRNTVYEATMLEGGHGFISTVRPLRLMWIALSNAIVSVLTLFLMVPWAEVRMARYLADCTDVEVVGDLNHFVGVESDRVSAFGDAFTDMEAFDFGIPG
ncbi:YjgN family protein [Celeribacter arenosi]|uniref:YjgN family protein n=1 Tax=Celeribacter arenosi TaxID=792649 RepID=A0ABP7KK29_9RHOB